MRKPDPSVVRLLFFVGALLALALILVFAGRILLPLLLGLALAYLLNPLVSRLERRGWPRSLGTATVFAALGYNPHAVTYPALDGRPIPLSEGEPIRELF